MREADEPRDDEANADPSGTNDPETDQSGQDEPEADASGPDSRDGSRAGSAGLTAVAWLRDRLRRPSRERLIGWSRERLTNTYRIARWEVSKNAGGVDRRTVAIALVALVGLGALATVALAQGVAVDEDIYRVGVEPDSPYYGPLEADPTFRVQRPSFDAVDAGEQEVLVTGVQVRAVADGQKGRAALSEMRSTIKRHNDDVMRAEENRSAAFPVIVNVSYESRDVSELSIPERLAESRGDDGDSGGGPGSDGDGDGRDLLGDGDSEEGTAGEDPDGDDDASDGAADSSDGDAGGGDGGSSFAARLTGGSVSGTPSAIAPPFPFRSLVLAFVFVLPLNFIIQAYGSTILSERINRRGELLLVAPVTRTDVIAGKTLPYFAGAVGVAAAITLVLRGSIVSVLAVIPLAMLFLAATFLGAMFARSFKELTFVTVTITVSLTSYAFVPAIFTDVTPIALISPLTLVVRDLQDQAITLGQFAFSTLPPTLTALVLFGLGAGLYREEDMFTQRPIPAKVLDALAGPIRRKRHVALVTAVLLPFVLVTELVVVALLFALGEISVVLVLLAVAVIEEVAKSLHVYASYVHSRFDRRFRTALVLGTCSGIGFFLAEKLSLIAQLVDLQSRDVGRAQMNDMAVVGMDVPLGVVVLGLLVLPLALHVVTASISAVGASRGKRAYLGAVSLAVAVHFAYNLTVVSILVS